jgi:hypothetical protein
VWENEVRAKTWRILALKRRVELAWWCMPIIPALRRLRHEDLEFKASLGYREIPCLNNKKKKERKKKKKVVCVCVCRVSSNKISKETI